MDEFVSKEASVQGTHSGRKNEKDRGDGRREPTGCTQVCSIKQQCIIRTCALIFFSLIDIIALDTQTSKLLFFFRTRILCLFPSEEMEERWILTIRERCPLEWESKLGTGECLLGGVLARSCLVRSLARKTWLQRTVRVGAHIWQVDLGSNSR